MDITAPWNVEPIYRLQATAGLQALMEALSVLGSQPFFLLGLPILFWAVNRKLGMRLALLLIATSLVNLWLKLFFHMPRPYWVDERVLALNAEQSYGMPSGHAMLSVVMWGYLALYGYANWRSGWAKGAMAVVSLLLILSVSLSRLYLGVHFSLDVIVGGLIGLLLLVCYRLGEEAGAAWWRSQRFTRQLTVSLVGSFLCLAATWAVLSALSNRPDPTAWADLAAISAAKQGQSLPIDPRNPEDLISIAGMLLGAGIGLALLQQAGSFSTGGLPSKMIVRYLIGVIGVLIIWRGLGAIFPRDASLLAYGLRYLRYMLLLIWIVYGAAWSFKRLRVDEA